MAAINSSTDKRQVVGTEDDRLVTNCLEAVERHVEFDFGLPTEAPHLIAGIETNQRPAPRGQLLREGVAPSHSTFLICQLGTAARLDIAMLLPRYQQDHAWRVPALEQFSCRQGR